MIKNLSILKLLLPIILFIAFVPTLYRAYKINWIVTYRMGEGHHAFLEVIRNDAPLIALILGGLVLTAVIKNRWLAFIPFLVAAAMLLALLLDVIVYRQFSLRLTWADVVKFSDYAINYILDFNGIMIFGIVLSGVAFIAVAIVIFHAVRSLKLSFRNGSVIMAAITILSAACWVSKDTGYVHFRFYQNVIAYNQVIASEHRGYSEEFTTSAKNPFENHCVIYPRLSGPIIIYMVESLSSYQTDFFSGQNDWMPRLDDIARNNVALTDFYANGFTTEDGEVSLLTAEHPLYPPKNFSNGGSTNFAGQWKPERSLPRILEEQGYESYFLTSGDLSFSSTGKWASSIGFDHVQGSTHPFYDGMERFHFDSAGDEALVDHVLQTLDHATKQPFIFVKTVSSHHPHVHPDTGERSVEAVMRYTDSQIGRLHDELDTMGFFETGHLIIVGDHRSMLPLTKGEIDRIGMAKAYTQVPAILVSNTLNSKPEIIKTPYSHVDLSNTLMGLFGGEMCHSTIKGVIWGEKPAPPEYILHRRGDNRNQISIFSDERAGVVTLDGEDTHFVGTDFDNTEQDDLVKFVNYMRVKSGIKE
ncbi:LTA synthase family protein [Roseovarius sp. EL26]|uniref:LTA synthase family protein n=1 Tax=Roseovarius sp. EL26 TaxID=2126672 RepID=UPI000EA046C0|nr:LTA synthase family protein [Roseovarius sp. EL26]